MKSRRHTSRYCSSRFDPGQGTRPRLYLRSGTKREKWGGIKEKSLSPAGLTALRVLLLLVVGLFLPETRVWGFEAGPRPASGQIAFASASAVGDIGLVAKHGDMPSPRPGEQSHHGAMSAWMKKRFAGYDPDLAPAILMPEANHRATFGVYNTWRASMRKKMGGTFDWEKVSESEMRRLSEDMFDAADVPRDIRRVYWDWFARMKAALSNLRKDPTNESK